MRYELADYEWSTIKPMLPNKPRGVPRVNDRRVLDGIFGCCDPAGQQGVCGSSGFPSNPINIMKNAERHSTRAME
jgi:hypothetical protein